MDKISQVCYHSYLHHGPPKKQPLYSSNCVSFRDFASLEQSIHGHTVTSWMKKRGQVK